MFAISKLLNQIYWLWEATVVHTELHKSTYCLYTVQYFTHIQYVYVCAYVYIHITMNNTKLLYTSTHIENYESLTFGQPISINYVSLRIYFNSVKFILSCMGHLSTPFERLGKQFGKFLWYIIKDEKKKKKIKLDV